MSKKVFVSGCFDMLHSGHVAFFKEAASYGDLYVGLGSDKTVFELKARETINSEDERLYMVKAIRHVKDAFVNSGSGLLDFDKELRELKPDYFVVNEDGYSDLKREICEELNIELHVLERFPETGLPERSTTSIRKSNFCNLPYRIDLAGTWIDQPYVSKYAPGWALTLSLEPIFEYFERSGMSTSTRNVAKKIWPYNLPLEKPKKIAKMLFSFENIPGKEFVSGAQDAIGICMPGLVRHYYDNEYWPLKFEENHDEETFKWLEKHISMVLLWPREDDLDLLGETYINEENVKSLTQAAENTWEAINNKDLKGFAKGVVDSFNAQTTMFPAMINEKILKAMAPYKEKALGWKLSGAGGGGYLILVSDKPIEGTMPIKIRRKGSDL
ncbi:adenylyltransferase/cytidyltransferase family protein [Neotamlana laminarinivorans]|uniref:Adenylyltransferase/cytidyltransferase family protein n=1 Tax=Neotamlana laminarinivorans TaxID=2883124 RepID=A0A9X1L2Z3_9FLAO|nr:adenylyltransferase/cytidyltransferase family protein [Tamlana laminarinivorans]MCB4797727.1 adenylyltransferase/cytidyltransferase family protein [Tamlana laminarinivorans]